MLHDQLHTILVFSENSPGVLQRLSVMFTRRKLNIESLTASETERKGISRITIVLKCEEDLIDKVVKQIARIIEVVEVSVHKNSELIYKEIAFFKVAACSEKRVELEELAHRYGASMVNVSEENIVLEKTGTEDEVNSLFLLLKPLGIKEFVRSGRIAIIR